MIVSQTDAGWILSVAAPPQAHADVWLAVLEAAEARLRALDAPADGPGPLLALQGRSLRAGDGWNTLSVPDRARLLDFVVGRANLLLPILLKTRARIRGDKPLRNGTASRRPSRSSLMEIDRWKPSAFFSPSSSG